MVNVRAIIQTLNTPAVTSNVANYTELALGKNDYPVTHIYNVIISVTSLMFKHQNRHVVVARTDMYNTR